MLSSPLFLAAAGFVGLGLTCLLIGVWKLARLRPGSGSANCLLGAVLLGGGAATGAVGTNLYGYERLTHERDVVDIHFERLGHQHYAATLHYADRDAAIRYELLGDEWQLDARILKWHGLAQLAGMDSRYRLERLSGRYRDTAQEITAARSVHTLGEAGGLDLWALARDYDGLLPWVDAVYGSATYLPMRDGARYRVRITQSGLIARPLDERAAADAGHAGGWRAPGPAL